MKHKTNSLNLAQMRKKRRKIKLVPKTTTSVFGKVFLLKGRPVGIRHVGGMKHHVAMRLYLLPIGSNPKNWHKFEFPSFAASKTSHNYEKEIPGFYSISQKPIIASAGAITRPALYEQNISPEIKWLAENKKVYEINYEISEPFLNSLKNNRNLTRMGIGTTLVKELMFAAKEAGETILVAHVKANNSASRGVMEKCGFTRAEGFVGNPHEKILFYYWMP